MKEFTPLYPEGIAHFQVSENLESDSIDKKEKILAELRENTKKLFEPRGYKILEIEPEPGVYYNLRKDGYPKEETNYMFRGHCCLSGQECEEIAHSCSVKRNQADHDFGRILDGFVYTDWRLLTEEEKKSYEKENG